MYNMLVIKFPTQRNDEQVALVNYEVNKIFVQISESETNDEEDVLDIVFTIRRKTGGNRISVNVAVLPRIMCHSILKQVFRREEICFSNKGYW